MNTIWAKGHPVHLKKADIKNTKKCEIEEDYIESKNGVIIRTIIYKSGISNGTARFVISTPKGASMCEKFLKLLKK